MQGERLARGGVISLLGSAFAALAALVLTSLVGNLLGAAGTGIFFQAVGIFTILTQVLRLGTNSGIVRFIAERRAFERAGDEWRVIVIAAVPVAVVSGMVAILLALFADSLAVVLAAPADRDGMRQLLTLMAPFVVAGALLGVVQIAARMLRGVGTFTVLQSILVPASRLFLVGVVALGGVSAYAAFQAWLVPMPIWLIVGALIILPPVWRDVRRRSGSPADRVRFGRFWRFNAPRAVSGGMEAALEWADVIIVAVLASPEAAGVYAVVTRVVRAGGIVDKAMRVAVSPTIATLLARAEHASASELHTRVVRAMILLNWPFYLLLISMGGSVLQVFGEEFIAGWGPMAIMAAAAMLQSAAGMLQSVLLQGGKSTWQMYNKSLALAVSVGGNILLVPLLGIWGAALTWVAVMAVDTAIAAVQVHRGLGVALRLKPLLVPALTAVLIFGGGGVGLQLLLGVGIGPLLVSGLLLVAVYGVTLWSFRHPLRIRPLWSKVPLIGRYA